MDCCDAASSLIRPALQILHRSGLLMWRERTCTNGLKNALQQPPRQPQLQFRRWAEGDNAVSQNSNVAISLKCSREECFRKSLKAHVQKVALQPFPQRNFTSKSSERACHHNAQSVCSLLVPCGVASMSALAASSAMRRALAAPASGVALSSSRLALCRSASRAMTTSVHFKASGLPVGQLGTQTKNTEEVRELACIR